MLKCSSREQSTKQIKYQNQQDEKSQFDLVNLKELLQRSNLDHSIEDHHKVEFYFLLFIENGKGSHTIDFTDYKCSKGTMLTVRKDQIHKFNKKGSLEGFLLAFTDEFLISYLEEIESQKTLLLFNEQLGEPKVQLDNLNFDHIKQNIRRIENEYVFIKDNYSLNIIRSELHILITKLFRIKADQETIDVKTKYLKEFVRFQTLLESNVTASTKVQEYAKLMGVSTKTLNNITKSIVHKSAKEFIDEICIKQIKRLLINTKLSIKEIAYQSGFDETTNFYKYFKRQTQTTPEQFRTNQ